MLLHKLPKLRPVRNFMPTTPLILRDGSTVPSLSLALKPHIQSIAADVQHLTHIELAFTTFHCCKRFLAKVVAIGAGIGFLDALYSPTIRPDMAS